MRALRLALRSRRIALVTFVAVLAQRLRYPAAMRCAPRALIAAPWLAAAWLVGGVASAQAATPQGPIEERWYGWQSLISVGASYSVFATGIGTETPWLAGAGLAGAALGGPIIHLAHGRAGPAAASIGLNLGLPLAGAVLGAGLVCGLGNCKGDLAFASGMAAVVVGGLAGMLAAGVIDVAVLAREDVAVPSATGSSTSGAAAWPDRPGAAAPPFRLAFRF